MGDLQSSFHTGSQSGALQAILDSRANVAIWERAIPVAASRQIAAWGSRAATPFDSILDSENYDLGGVALGLERDVRAWLLVDLALLIGYLLGLSGVSRFRLFFGAIRNDQCRKFHVDYLRLRLVTTYAGPGTEWLPDEAVNRSALADTSDPLRGDAPLGDRSDEANQRIVNDALKIRKALTGDVVLLKGAHFGAGSHDAAVHRSPPIEGAQITRVALVVTAYPERHVL
jgi:hypothetical protein